MPGDFKINSNLFTSLNELIKNPFIIMDQQGNIFSYNKKASELFNKFEESKNFFDILEPVSAEGFNLLVTRTLTGDYPYKETINLSHHKKQINSKISIIPYSEDNHVFLFCELEMINSQKKVGNSIYEIESCIELNKETVELIEEISIEFPLTLTGKDHLRQKLDNLGYLVWIEDLSGNFIIVNKSFQSVYNMKHSVLEGKPSKDFVLPVYQPFWDAINEIVISAGLTLRLGNIAFSGNPIKDNVETLKTPIYDSKGKIICTIGIIKKATGHRKEVTKLEVNGLKHFHSLVKYFPKAAALISEDDNLNTFNNHFAELFTDEIFPLGNIPLDKLIPADLYEKLNLFKEDKKIEQSFIFSGNFRSFGRKNESFHVYLYKIINDNIIEGIFMIVEEEQSNDDLENLIKGRGTMFEILLENYPEPVFIYDTENLRFLEVNEAALTLYGYKKEEFLQMDLTDLYTPEDIQTLLDSSVSKDNNGKFRGPFRHRRKDGSSVFVEISKMNLKFNNKDSHFNIVRDVSEKLEFKKQIQLYKSVFDNSNSLVFITESNGFVSYANKSVYDILKYSEKEISNTSFAAFVQNEERGKVNSSIFQSQTGKAVSLNIDLKKADGTFLKAELNASPVIDFKGDIESFIIICNYENEPREVVKEVVKEVIKEVVKEVPALPIANGRSAPDLDKSFLSSMFHELLTPINVIIGFTQELTDTSSAITPEQKEAVDIINQNRITLLNSMNSVVEYLNIERDHTDLQIKEISITEIIDYLQKDIEELKARGIQFSYGKISSSLRFQSDKQKFQHLISSLLRIITEVTSVKKIYFSAFQYSENKFVISVKDNYSNVSGLFLGRVKDIFLEENPKDYGVSRLSLRLVKKLLKLLNGTFEILNKTDEKQDYGFVFSQNFIFSNKEETSDQKKLTYLSEPEDPVKSYEPVPPVRKSTLNDFQEVLSSRKITEKKPNDVQSNPDDFQLKGKLFLDDDLTIADNVNQEKKNRISLSELTCLYIEDQIDSQILFKVQMKDLKDVKFAVSFEEALPLLDNYHFDFIVLDINLQGEYNGLDALKIIHKMPAYKKTPIIAVTAYVLPGDKEKFIATGFQDFISKPIFREKMIDSLERIFLIQL